ncbi:bifunctional chorismate mutase/prephenate dehydrogenase [Desulfospira joergensenii]|uniref:bifunctional chorismate mutase/prephenate dehydrogenase n=1 Tax=Desulfospira joergensenii TaxID=53329 RepID=UPI0003B3D05D|nr:bifunctional chorismate mutase/prephenate dehydrogenase [Desulfospira joergensenii]
MEKHNKNFQEQIKPLRDEIDRIDADILSLLVRRQEQVEQVVALKKACKVQVYHPAREEDLISKLRIQAVKTGVDPDFLEDLYRVILRQSRVKQTRQMEHKAVRPGAKVLIIGGTGQMGSLFAGLFKKSRYEVRILGEPDWDHAPDLCSDIDLVLVSVPIEKTGQVIQKIAPFLPERTLMADLTSVKQEPVAQMLASHKGPVMGIHPLFGPSSGSLDKQIIVVSPGRNFEECQWLMDQLGLWGAVVVKATPEEHDEVMELVQALRHFATFCFGRFLFQKKADIQRTLEFSSPIYRLELGMVGRLFAQDPGLYSEIIFATPKRRKLLRDFIDSMEQHIDMLEKNDKDLFIDRFRKIAQWFGPFGGQAMRESTFLINKLIERF